MCLDVVLILICGGMSLYCQYNSSFAALDISITLLVDVIVHIYSYVVCDVTPHLIFFFKGTFWNMNKKQIKTCYYVYACMEVGTNDQLLCALYPTLARLLRCSKPYLISN